MNEQPFDTGETTAPWDEKETCRSFSRVGFALMMLLVMTMVGQVVIDLLAHALAWNFTDAWWYSYAVSMVSIYGFGMPSAWLVLRTLPKAPFNTTYTIRRVAATAGPATDDAPRYERAVKPALTFGSFALILLVGVGYLDIGAQIGEGVMSTLSSLTTYEYSNGLNDLTYETPWWGTLLCVVILAPIAEEFLFRKLLMDRTRRYGDTVAILISAVFFALFHGNLYQFFYALLLGLLLGYLYARTGRLRWSIALHMVINFIGSIIPLGLRALLGTAATETPLTLQTLADHAVGYVLLALYSMILFGAMVASVILTIVMRRRIKLGQGEVVMPRGARFGIVMGNAGMMLSVIIYLLVIMLALLPT